MTESPPSWLERLSRIDLATLSESDRADVSAALDAYELQLDALDPVRFATKRLGIKPWSRQAEILRAVAKHPRVAVRSGHKVGKSTSAAILALWWMHRWPDGRVVLTAPTGRQVRIVLWREVRRLHQRAPVPLGGVLHELPDRGLQYPDGREILGFSTDEPDRLSGVSGPHMLYIVDEGSGVAELIYEAIEGNRAGGAHLAVFGNPTQTSGTFHAAFTNSVNGWFALHVSSEESPNITGECYVPGLATPEWVAEKKDDWGEESPLYQVRVKGNFPTQSENAVIGLALIEAARRRYDETPAEGLLEIGVDVARFGDDESVIQPRRGSKALPATVLRSMDNVQVAGRVRQIAIDLKRGDEKPRIKVDVIGVGAGVADILRSQGEFEVFDVNVGESANVEIKGEPGYARLRDQLWFGARAWLKSGGAIPDDGKLQEDLLRPHYGFTVDGKLKVESKDEIKKRLGRSPDRADALCLAIYNPPKKCSGMKEGPADFFDV